MNLHQKGRTGARFALVFVHLALVAVVTSVFLPKAAGTTLGNTAMVVMLIAIAIGLTIDFILPRFRRHSRS
jgi:hypothetical protein